ncbi:MAG: hypothetical protein KDK97_03985 [Verrucomicrobiales bacterium]|nr:hypothetical protein [Verrucomicrobiales bacterium]MCP5559722.1 hypothetical protein [Verrucomicrobiaceae bacterium]
MDGIDGGQYGVSVFFVLHLHCILVLRASILGRDASTVAGWGGIVAFSRQQGCGQSKGYRSSWEELGLIATLTRLR